MFIHIGITWQTILFGKRFNQYLTTEITQPNIICRTVNLILILVALLCQLPWNCGTFVLALAFCKIKTWQTVCDFIYTIYWQSFCFGNVLFGILGKSRLHDIINILHAKFHNVSSPAKKLVLYFLGRKLSIILILYDFILNKKQTKEKVCKRFNICIYISISIQPL